MGESRQTQQQGGDLLGSLLGMLDGGGGGGDGSSSGGWMSKATGLLGGLFKRKG